MVSWVGDGLIHIITYIRCVSNKQKKLCYYITNEYLISYRPGMLIYYLRSARKKQGVSSFHGKLANVQRMKAIDILLEADLR